MSVSKINQLMQERRKVHEQMTDLKKEVFGGDEKRTFTADEEAKWAKLDSRYDELDKQIGIEERHLERERTIAGQQAPAELRGDQPKGGMAPEERAAKYGSALKDYLINGVRDMSEESRSVLVRPQFANDEKRTMVTTNAASAGFLINNEYGNQLIEIMKHYGGMFRAVGTRPNEAGEQVPNVLRTSTGAPWSTPRMDDTANIGEIIGENVAASDQDLAGDRFELGSYIFSSKAIKLSYAQLQDDAFNITSYINRVSGTRIGRRANVAFTVGTGTNEPTGIIEDAQDSGVTFAANGAGLSQDDFIDAELSVDEAYRQMGKWMFATETLKILRKMEDTEGRKLWEPSVKAGVPSLFMGREYVINDDLPTIATSSNKSILFGDFSYYTIRMVQDLMVLRANERYIEQFVVGFFGYQRMDGKLSVPQAVKYMSVA